MRSVFRSRLEPAEACAGAGDRHGSEQGSRVRFAVRQRVASGRGWHHDKSGGVHGSLLPYIRSTRFKRISKSAYPRSLRNAKPCSRHAL